MTGRIEVASKRDGFRRGGVAHSRQPVVHCVDDFTAEQLAAIRAEPMLTVRDLPDDPDPDPAPPRGPDAGDGTSPDAAAGVAHSRQPVVHCVDDFTAEQLAAIRAEPMLTVRDLPDDPDPDPAPPRGPDAGDGTSPDAAAGVAPPADTPRRSRK